MENKKIIIVMPVANEEKTIEDTIKVIRQSYPELWLYFIMDSYSTDQTEEIIKKFQNKDDKVKLVFYTKSTGVASCYMHGFEQALKDQADYVIEMDAGGSHNPDQIKDYLEMINKGYDCIFGSRFMPQGKEVNVALYRRCISKYGSLLANFVLKTHFSDMTSGFEAFSKNVLKSFNFSNFLSKAHMYQTEMKYYCRHTKYIEIPIIYKGSKSCFKIKTLFKALYILFNLKRNESKVMKKQ